MRRNINIDGVETELDLPDDFTEDEVDAAVADAFAVPPTQPKEDIKPPIPTRGREDYGLYGKIFPRSSHADYNDKGILKSTLSAAGDVLSIPARAIAAGASGLGTIKGGGSIRDAARAAGDEFGQYATEEKGALGFAQDIAYDPANMIPGGVAVKTGIKGAQAALKGNKIASEILSKAKLGKAALVGAETGATSASINEATKDDFDIANVAVATAFGAATPLMGVSAGKTIGAIEEKIGKTFQPGDLKIQKSTAKLSYGPSINAKKEHLQKVIIEHGLTKGSYADEAIRAQDMANQRFAKVEEIVNTLANDPNAKKVNPYDILKQGISVNELAGKDANKRIKYQKIIDSIEKALSDDGVPENVTIADLVQIKRELDPEGIIFKRGLDLQGIDPAEIQVKKRMYYNLVNAIGDISPETKVLNKQAKDLLDASTVLDQAASRIKNKDAISLTDHIAGGAAAIASLSNPGTLWIAAPVLGAKALSKGGRLSNTMISQGRWLQGKKDITIEKTLEDIRRKSDVSNFEKDTNVKLPPDVDVPTVFRKYPTSFKRAMEYDNKNRVSLGEEIATRKEQARLDRELKDVTDKNKNIAARIMSEKRFFGNQRGSVGVGVSGSERRELIKTQRKDSGKKFIDSSFDRKGMHSPSSVDNSAPFYDLTENDIYPEDVYSRNGREYYGTGEVSMDREVFDLIKKVEGRPDAKITIYRAVDKDGKEILPGDWVTPIRQYAVEHGKSSIPGGYKIVSKNVSAKDVFTTGDSWLEAGYHPQGKYDPANPDITAKAPVKIMGGLAAGSAGMLTAYGAVKSKAKHDKEKRRSK